jgi:sulfite reductase (ferredoxin)
VLAGAKALLVTEGLDPATDAETLIEFERTVASKGVVPARYQNLGALIGDLGPKEPTVEFASAKVDFAREFVETCRIASEQAAQKLKRAPKEESSAAEPDQVESEPRDAVEAAVYDLRGVMCPLNYVKTKLKLEMMDTGERLEVWLDAGDPIKNVPMSLRNDGHKILLQSPLDAESKHFKVLVEKVEG